MTATKNWFEVDRKGLAKLQERKGKEFVIYELVQNAWDTDAKKVDISLKWGAPGFACLEVVDDHPEGWKNLEHAWTLFAESEKKADPEKRGRFNLGEKLVLALCKEAVIETTTGSVKFDEEGRHKLRSRRPQGSAFLATLKLSPQELADVAIAFFKLLPPAGCRTTFNGQTLDYRKPIREIEATLPTEIADGEGILRRTARKTKVQVIEVRPGEVSSIYEMGIPVCATLDGSDKYSYNVMMKVPLNADRDNVTAAYLRDLRTLVLNEVYTELSPEDASAEWARSALESDKVEKAAADAILTLRFGAKRVVADPSDPEGTKMAVSQGYTVIPPRALSKEEWENVRKHELALPAGKVTPSPKPYGSGDDPLQYLDREKWTAGMHRIVAYAADLAKELLGAPINIQIASKVTWPYAATYGPGNLTFNLGRLGHAWFNMGPNEQVDELLIHEFGHHYSGDHLSEAYHDALCRLGARLATLALSKPELFKKHGRM